MKYFTVIVAIVWILIIASIRHKYIVSANNSDGCEKPCVLAHICDPEYEYEYGIEIEGDNENYYNLRFTYPCRWLETQNSNTGIITRHGGCLIHGCEGQYDHYRNVK